jgi:hypothetical protein
MLPSQFVQFFEYRGIFALFKKDVYAVLCDALWFERKLKFGDIVEALM